MEGYTKINNKIIIISNILLTSFHCYIVGSRFSVKQKKFRLKQELNETEKQELNETEIRISKLEAQLALEEEASGE